VIGLASPFLEVGTHDLFLGDAIRLG